MFARFLVGLLFVASVASANLVNALEFPPRATGFVNDLAVMMSQAERDTLNQKLVQFRDTSRVSIVVVTITSASDYNHSGLADLGVALFDKWKLGEASTDSGLLVIVAGKSPPFKIRIVTGRGVEGAVPDAIAKRIIEETMKPVMHKAVPSAYAEGLTRGVDALMERTKNEFAPKTKTVTNNDSNVVVLIVTLLLAFTFFGVILFYRQRGRKEEAIRRENDEQEARQRQGETTRGRHCAPPPQMTTRPHKPTISSPKSSTARDRSFEESMPLAVTPSPRQEDSFSSSESSISSPDFGGGTAGGGAGDD